MPGNYILLTIDNVEVISRGYLKQAYCCGFHIQIGLVLKFSFIFSINLLHNKSQCDIVLMLLQNHVLNFVLSPCMISKFSFNHLV